MRTAAGRAPPPGIAACITPGTTSYIVVDLPSQRVAVPELDRIVAELSSESGG